MNRTNFTDTDTAFGHYKLMYEEPADTIIDGQVSCVVEKVVIRRKQMLKVKLYKEMLQ